MITLAACTANVGWPQRALSRGSGACRTPIRFTLDREPIVATNVFKYRLQWADGSDACEHEDSEAIKPNEILWIGGGRRLRVLELASVADDDSRFDAVLTVERADGPPGEA